MPAGGGVRGCIRLQWIFLEDSFNEYAHFIMADLWAHLFPLCWVFSSFSLLLLIKFINLQFCCKSKFKTLNIHKGPEKSLLRIKIHSVSNIKHKIWISMPHPPYSPNLTPSDIFFFPWMKKNPQREIFCWCGRGEIKNVRSTKRDQNWWVQKLFWAVEKSLIRFISSNGEYFEGDWSLNM